MNGDVISCMVVEESSSDQVTFKKKPGRSEPFRHVERRPSQAEGPSAKLMKQEFAQQGGQCGSIQESY